MYKYAIEIIYSEEDEKYIAMVPELTRCYASGKDEREALENVIGSIENWIETARSQGRDIPAPKGRGILKEARVTHPPERYVEQLDIC